MIGALAEEARDETEGFTEAFDANAEPGEIPAEVAAGEAPTEGEEPAEGDENADG